MARPIPDLDPMTAAEVAADDNIIIDDTSAQETKRIPVGDLLGLPLIGWTAAGQVWSYSAWNSATRVGTITVPTNATTKYTPGDKIRISQSTGGTKYGFVVEVAATSLKVYFGLDYTLNNEAISTPYYSSDVSPQGYAGPQLIREVYKNSTGSNSTRWILEQSGWGYGVGDNTSATTLANVNFPVAYASNQITFNISCLGYKNGGAPSAPTDANSGAGFYMVGVPVAGGASFSPSILARDANQANGPAVYHCYSWIARGVVV